MAALLTYYITAFQLTSAYSISREKPLPKPLINDFIQYYNRTYIHLYPWRLATFHIFKLTSMRSLCHCSR